MRNSECIPFLQWALPRLRLRWAGFRKVRRQVCRRIRDRIAQLGLTGFEGYREYLLRRPEEWRLLDACCRISISRFYRDRGVFDALGDHVVPRLRDLLGTQEDCVLRCWSVGCASGEEAYTVSALTASSPGPTKTVARRILGTDADAHLIERARRGCYPESSLKDVPESWRRYVFEKADDEYCVKEEFRTGVEFRVQDVRRAMPSGPFHLILCRNLVFTYFDTGLQIEILKEFERKLVPGGFLVIGIHESLPVDDGHLTPVRSNRESPVSGTLRGVYLSSRFGKTKE